MRIQNPESRIQNLKTARLLFFASVFWILSPGFCFATGISTNKTFMLNTGNQLPPSVSNFFVVNSNLLNQSVNPTSVAGVSSVDGKNGAITGVLTNGETTAVALSNTLSLTLSSNALRQPLTIAKTNGTIIANTNLAGSSFGPPIIRTNVLYAFGDSQTSGFNAGGEWYDGTYSMPEIGDITVVNRGGLQPQFRWPSLLASNTAAQMTLSNFGIGGAKLSWVFQTNDYPVFFQMGNLGPYPWAGGTVAIMGGFNNLETGANDSPLMWNVVRSSYEALIARCLIDDYAGYTVSGYGHGGVAGASGQYGWVTTGEDLYPGNIPAQLSAQEFGAYGWPFAFWTNNTAGTMDTGIGQHETRLLNSKYLQFTLANKSAIALFLMSSPSGDTYQVTVNGAVISTNTTYYSTTNGNGDTGNYPLLCWIQNPPTNCAIVLSNTATDSGVVDFIGFGWVESTNSGIPSYVRSKQIILGSPVADNYEGASDLVLYRMANCAYDACSVFGGQYPVWFANNYNAWVSNTDQEPVDPAHFTPAGAWQVAKNFASATKASGGKDLNFVDLHGGQFFGDSFISLGAGFNGTFTGNGGPLTNLNGAALVSPINQTNLPAVAITNGEAATLVLPLSALSQSSASTGQYAEWNGSAWVPATVSGGGGGSATYYNQSQLWTNTAGQIGLLSGAWLTNVTEWGTPEFTNAAATVYPLYFLATTGTYAPSFDFGGVEDWQFGLSSSSFYIASMYPTANVPLVTLFNGANPMLAIDYQLQLDNGANVYAGGLTNNTPLGFIGNGGGLTNIKGAALVSPINQTNLPAVAITNGEAATLVLPLSALSQSSATTGQLAEWNGSAWVPTTVSGGTASYYNAAQLWTNTAGQIGLLSGAWLTNVTEWGTPEFTNAAATVYPLYFLATTGTYAPSFDFGGVEDWQFGLSSSSFYIASMYPTANVPLVTLFNGANPMLAVDYQLQLDNGANVYAGGLTNNTPLGFIGNGGGLTNINGAALVSPINQTNLPAVAITNGEAATLVLPLSALSQSSATTGQLAEWNGSAWVPATVSGGGGAVYYNADQIWTNAASQISILTAADLTNINGFGTTSLGGGTTTIDGSGNASFAGGIMGQTLSTSGAINIGSQINGNGSGLNNVPLSGLGSSSATTGNWIGFGASSWGVGTTLTNLALNFGVDVKGKTTVSNLVVASSAMIGTNLTVSYGNVTLAAGPDEFSDQGGNADLWSTSLGIVTISKAAAGDALGTLDAATVNASAGMSNGGVYIAATSTATNVSGPAGTTNVQSGVTNQVVNSSGTQTNGFPKFLAAQVLHSSAYGSWATNQGGIGIFTNYGNACDNFASLEIIYTNATTTTYGTKFATYTFAFPYSSPPCVNDFEGLANDVNGRPSVMYAVTTSTTMTLYFTALVTPTTGGKYTNMFTITGM
jgi:hypothetical protein